MVRFGIVGTGKITEEFVMSARASGVADPVAVCSRAEETGRSHAERQGIPHVYTDLETMARSGRIDAVYVASPNAAHARQAQAFLDNGIPVLMEKPAASNLSELEPILGLAVRKNLLFMEAVKSTVTPVFLQARRLLPELGPIRHFFASFCQYSSRYDAHLAGEYRNAFDPALSNGSLMDIGVYGVYPAAILFGRPRGVKAIGQLLRTGVDGSGSLLLHYGEMDAVIVHSKNSDSTLPAEIQGERATLRIDRINLPHELEIRYRDGRVVPVPVETTLPFMSYEILEFCGLLASGKVESSVNTHEASRISLEVMDEARRQMGVRYPAD